MEKREKGRARRWLIRLCSAALVALMVLPVLPNAVVLPASAVTQAEINQMKEDAAALKKQRAELQKQLKAIQADKSKALDQKALLEQQINATQAEINNIAAQITQYDQLIAQKETELAATEEKERAQYELFCKRVREMEEQGEVSYWSILFSSDDFSDLLDNAKAEQEAAKAELKSQQSQVDALITEISGQESQVKAAEAKLQAAANAADAEIRAAEKELASQIANVPSESGFLWPLPGRYNLSSLYGSRKHPVTGKANNHTGIDVPAPSGTSILACKSGVVTTSTYNNSYGNYVVVSHSDGTSTLYAHMSRRNASKGQTVSQGQVIGYVGTTGSSTGNHLHLEIRVNGSRRDPINYFQSLPLTISGVRIK